MILTEPSLHCNSMCHAFRLMATQLFFLLCLVYRTNHYYLNTLFVDNIADCKHESPGGNVDQCEVTVGAGEPVLHSGAHHPAGEHPRGLHQAQSHPDLGGGANAA